MINEKLSYKIGAGLMRPIFNQLKAKYDYEEHGGTPLLGVNGISIVCHGSSGPKSIMNSILVAQKCIDNNLIADTQKSLAIHFGH
jgi:glycerol-3-phosphate acyltransferase PlsX